MLIINHLPRAVSRVAEIRSLEFVDMAVTEACTHFGGYVLTSVIKRYYLYLLPCVSRLKFIQFRKCSIKILRCKLIENF